MQRFLISPRKTRLFRFVLRGDLRDLCSQGKPRIIANQNKSRTTRKWRDLMCYAWCCKKLDSNHKAPTVANLLIVNVNAEAVRAVWTLLWNIFFSIWLTSIILKYSPMVSQFQQIWLVRWSPVISSYSSNWLYMENAGKLNLFSNRYLPVKNNLLLYLIKLYLIKQLFYSTFRILIISWLLIRTFYSFNRKLICTCVF